jgi:glycerate dehydrogenase
MNAVILDCDSLGPHDLNMQALYDLPLNWRVYGATSPEQVVERIADADIVVTNKVPLTALTLSRAPKLKLITLTATGTNVVDLAAAQARDMVVCNAVKYCTGSVVQHTWALILALSTRLNYCQQTASDGTWGKSPFFCLLDYPVQELAGKVLGIIGAGELGRGVAAVAEAFGMRVIYAALPGRDYGADDRVEFEAFLAMADVVSVHCPLTPNTVDLIDADELTKMKPTAILVNTARGGIVNEMALKDALLANTIAGAAVDVLTTEPPREGNVLLDSAIPNLIVTPHCAWAARESRQRVVEQMAENIRDFLAAKTPARALPRV